MKFCKSLSGDGEIIKWNYDNENLVHWAHELSFEGFRLEMMGYKFPYLLKYGKAGDVAWCPVRGKDLYLSFQFYAGKSESGKPRRFQVDLDGEVIGEFELAETDEKYYLFCSEEKIHFYGYNRMYLRVIEGDNVTITAACFTTTPVFPRENAIENFTADNGSVRFTTARASECEIEYNGEKYILDEYLNNHELNIPDFCGGEITVTAKDQDGGEITYVAKAEAPSCIKNKCESFSHELFYEKRCSEKTNVTAFTAFGKGECFDYERIGICDESGEVFPSDTKVTSRWLDGSIKTISSEAVIFPDGRKYYLKSGVNTAGEAIEYNIPKWKNHITIENKEVDIIFADWKTELSGNAKKVLVREGVLASPYDKLRICEELTFYNGISGAVLKTGLENNFTQPRTVNINSWHVEFECDNKEEKSIYQIDDVFADINGEIVKARVEDSATDGVYVADFWQNYPKSKEYKKDKTIIGLMPTLGYDDIYSAYDEKERHKLLYYMEDEHYRIHMGMRKLFTIAFSSDKETSVALTTEILLHPDKDRIEKSEAFGKIICANEYTKDFDDSIRDGYDLLIKLREEKREYGMFNYGDWHGESGKNWGNNEYDMPYGGLIQYLRTGDADFADLGYISAKHMEEIDCVRVHSDKNLSGLFYLHTPGHSFFYDGIPEDSWDDFNTHVGHLFTEGLTQWYKVTGDERFKDAVLRCADTLAKYYCIDYDFMTEREPAWSMLVMASAFELTGDNKYKNAAKIIKDRVYYRQDKTSGAIKRLIDFADSERKMMFGGKPFMCGILMSAMMRYYKASGDREAIEITDGLAKWLCYEMWDEEQKGFWYTDAQKLRNVHCYPANSMEIIEGLLDSYGRTNDRLLYTRAEEAFIRATNLEYREGDIGKVLAMRLRFAPTSLKMLWEGKGD